ncbi:uncharacterized protein LOC144919216 [Branchiostoma floridae x Branchiostoma belcheri]
MAGNLNHPAAPHSPQHSSRASLPRQLQQQLNLQRNSGMFCDVTLQVQGARFPVHKCVLAAFSPHFSLLLSNSDRTLVELSSLTKEGVRAVIDFMYTSNFVLTQDNIVAISAAAWYLQITELSQDCQMYLLKNLHRGGAGGVSQGGAPSSDTSLQVQADSANNRRYDNAKRLQSSEANMQTSQPAQQDSNDPPTENELEQYSGSEGFVDEEIHSAHSSHSHDSQESRHKPSTSSAQQLDEVIKPVQEQPMGTEENDVITIKDEDDHESLSSFTAEEGAYSFDYGSSSTTGILAETSSSAPLEHRVTSDGIIVSAQADEDVFQRNLFSADTVGTHYIERPFQCSQCKFRFKTFHHLKIHMRIHTGEKPYHCDMCPSRFTRKDHLTQHQRKHTGERPYQCPICPHAFSQKSSLNMHMVRRHSSYEDTFYKCLECSANFPNRVDFMNHMLTQHQTHDRASTGQTFPNDYGEQVGLSSMSQHDMEQGDDSHAQNPATSTSSAIGQGGWQ